MSKIKKIKSGSGKIDGMNARTWIIYTIIYIIGLGFLSGYIKHYFPEDVVYLFGIFPFDMSICLWVAGISVWAIVTTAMLKRIDMKKKK